MPSNTLRATALSGADQAVSGSPAMFAGYALRNSHATNALVVQIYDNASAASGTLVATVGLPALGSVDVSLTQPVWCTAGVFVHPTGTGTLEGSVRIS